MNNDKTDNKFVLENTISTPDDFSLRRKDYISEMSFTDESLHVFVVVPVLITTRVTSRGEKRTQNSKTTKS
jgi:hypothetical protein